MEKIEKHKFKMYFLDPLKSFFICHSIRLVEMKKNVLVFKHRDFRFKS